MLTRPDIAATIRKLIHSQDDYLTVLWGIEDFNHAFEVKPNPELYAELICEETNEWMEEIFLHGFTPNLLKETIDVIYVLEGFLAANPEEELDISIDAADRLLAALDIINTLIAPIMNFTYQQSIIMEAFLEVQGSNMSKLDDDGSPLRRADGKVLKGPNYRPADMTLIAHPPEGLVELNKI